MVISVRFLSALSAGVGLAFANVGSAPGHSDFPFRLIVGTQPSPSKNYLISPFSAQAAMSMLLPGMQKSDGTLLARTIDGNADHLFKQMTAGHPELSIANSAWVDSRMKLRPAYAAALRKNFGADVSSFMHSSASVQKINDWTKVHTRGRIPSILDRLKDSDRLVLINAVAFDGEWAKQFDVKRTAPMAFHLSGGSTEQVPMMHMKESVGYAKSNVLRAIKLNYKGDAFSMVLMLPETSHDAASLLRSMNGGAFEKLMSSFDDSDKVNIALPKFKYSDEHQLAGPLSSMGLSKFFNEADFSGISSGLRRGKIDRVIQKTYVEVDERGTKAAAATGVVMQPTMVRVDQPEFIADRPFAFLIVHNGSNAVLFAGVVNKP